MNIVSRLIKEQIKNKNSLLKWTERFIFQQRLKFKYSDMTIYTSQKSMLNFFYNLIQPGQFSIVDTNIHMNDNQHTLGRNALQLLSQPNAGGSSIYSEALSIELLSRLLGVHLYKTEKELIYNFPNVFNNGGSGPMMDYACHYKSLILGVSVTRAMSFHREYTKKDATLLIEKKLNNMMTSSQNIQNIKFDRHILHIWTESTKNASIVKKVVVKNKKKYKDTVVLVSTINNNHNLFFNNNKNILMMVNAPIGCV